MGGSILLHGHGCAPLLSGGNKVAELERRSYGRDSLPSLADAQNCHIAVIENAAENALVDVNALDLVKAHLKGAAFDEPGLVDDAQIGDVGLGGPAMEPGGQHFVQRDNRRY